MRGAHGQLHGAGSQQVLPGTGSLPDRSVWDVDRESQE